MREVAVNVHTQKCLQNLLLHILQGSKGAEDHYNANRSPILVLIPQLQPSSSRTTQLRWMSFYTCGVCVQQTRSARRISRERLCGGSSVILYLKTSGCCAHIQIHLWLKMEAVARQFNCFTSTNFSSLINDFYNDLNSKAREHGRIFLTLQCFQLGFCGKKYMDKTRGNLQQNQTLELQLWCLGTENLSRFSPDDFILHKEHSHHWMFIMFEL